MYESRKGRELQGLSVVDLSTGKSLGEIKDIIYSTENNKVIGFLISDNGWLWGANLLLFEEAQTIGPDIVMISGEDKIHNTRHHPDYKKMYQDRIDIRGCELISDQGEIVGTIKDLVIDSHGNIIGYELSDGIVHDLLVGRKTIRVPEQMTLSHGVVFFHQVDPLLDDH